jgi:hypothetical protein
MQTRVWAFAIASIATLAITQPAIAVDPNDPLLQQTASSYCGMGREMNNQGRSLYANLQRALIDTGKSPEQALSMSLNIGKITRQFCPSIY